MRSSRTGSVGADGKAATTASRTSVSDSPYDSSFSMSTTMWI